jgi:hypothetical protein
MDAQTKIGGVLLVSFLTGCAPQDPQEPNKPPVVLPTARMYKNFDRMGKLLGENTNLLSSTQEDGPQISKALWNGALKALAALPTGIIDEKQGVISTQWYIPHEQSDHRFQVKILIIPSQGICVSALTVSVIHEIRQNGQWVLTNSSNQIAQHIKRQILLHARTYSQCLKNK